MWQKPWQSAPDCSWPMPGLGPVAPIYVNRDDPAWIVPKRFGYGDAINFGHPGRGIVLVAMAALIAVGPLLAGVTSL